MLKYNKSLGGKEENPIARTASSRFVRAASYRKKLFWIHGPVIVFVLSFFLLGAYLSQPRADIQLGQRVDGIRSAHLVSDPVAGRRDYILRVKPIGAPISQGSTIVAYSPGGTQLLSIPPDPTQPIQDLIDVKDLDGDGNEEIIGTFRGGTNLSPKLWIYNGDGTLRASFSFPLNTAIGAGGVKIYDVLPQNGQKRIVVVPETRTYTGATINVYFFNSSGQVIASPAVSRTSGGNLLDDAGVVVGDINGSGGSEIFVVVKARILAFNQNGSKLYYRELSSSPWMEGRRYGLYKLGNTNFDSDLELIIAADRVGGLGAVYESYDVPAVALSGPDSLTISPIWNISIHHSAPAFKPTNNNPFNYPIGVVFNGITDINADGVDEIVVTDTDPNTGRPYVRIINTLSGTVTAPLINGICIGVARLDTTYTLQHLIIYDTATVNPNTGIGEYSVWWFNPGTYTPIKLSESPAGALSSSTGLREVVFQEIPNQISLSEPETLPLGEIGIHFQAMVTRTNGIRAFVGYSGSGCGLATWTAQGGVIQRSLDMSTRPGKVVDAQKITDKNNYVWILNLESLCGTPSNAVRTAVQSGSTLVANGDL
jgi:hypothetical protein